jgi:hypothetical protein
MNIPLAQRLGIALLLSTTMLCAQHDSKLFEDPILLKAGDKIMGHMRYYPSPVFHDMNGDGVLDIVVGDLVGKLTVALGRKTSDGIAFEAETPLNSKNGQQLTFKNW